MNIAITGASGLLGAHLVAGLMTKHEVFGLDRHAWWGERNLPFFMGDLLDPAFLDVAIPACQADVLIHCAGTTDVDGCQRDPAQAMKFNAGLTRDLVRRIPESCLFIYISTDSVFSGNSSFWKETDAPSPCNVHGSTKLEGEREAAKHSRHLILRTNFYGWSSGRKKTSAEWMVNALKNGDAITLFDDFFFSPIYVADLVQLVSGMIDRESSGLFHAVGHDRVSKYEFGEMMAEAMKVPMSNVKKGSLSDAKFFAPRSSDISLCTMKISTEMKREVPGCRAGIERFLADRSKPLEKRF